MNPVVTVVNDNPVFQLTDEDRKLLADIRIIDGGGSYTDEKMHRMCIMQAVNLLTVQQRGAGFRQGERPTLQAHPVCVSGAIVDYLVELNDAIGARGRARLKEVVEDILNTCPLKRIVIRGSVVDRRNITPEYQAAEEKRLEILDRVPIQSDNGNLTKFTLDERFAAIREAAAVLRTDQVVEPADS